MTMLLLLLLSGCSLKRVCMGGKQHTDRWVAALTRTIPLTLCSHRALLREDRVSVPGVARDGYRVIPLTTQPRMDFCVALQTYYGTYVLGVQQHHTQKSSSGEQNFDDRMITMYIQ